MPQETTLSDRLRALVQEHMSAEGKILNWQGIADTLNKEGFLNSKGGKWTKTTVANHFQKKIKRRGAPCEHPGHSVREALLSEPSERSEQSSGEVTLSERTGKSEPSARSAEWEERAREIAEEVCQKMIYNIQNELKAAPTLAQDLEDELPEIPGKGRKESRLYGKVGVTIDGVLLKRLMTEAKQRSLSVGKLLDRILWHRYGRPALSFELPPEEQQQLKRENPELKGGLQTMVGSKGL